MKARIYKPAKTAMQSGMAKTGEWTLVFEPAARSQVEPLMGWNGQTDMPRQLQLWFDTQEEALAYAKKHGLECEVSMPKSRKIKPKTYSENFRFDKIG